MTTKKEVKKCPTCRNVMSLLDGDTECNPCGNKRVEVNKTPMLRMDELYPENDKSINEILSLLSGVLINLNNKQRSLVIRAVNSHEALLDACKRAEKFISDAFPHLKGAEWNTLGELRDAIAQAEGK